MNAEGETRSEPPRNWDAVVLGAGPAGLFCAREAARRGIRVAVAERQDRTGRKLSMAGGGMGNVTNRTLSPEHYVGENPAFCRAALRGFGCDDALRLLRELGIPWEEREFGQIFCLRPAALLARRLTDQCREAGVIFHLGEAPRIKRRRGLPPSPPASGRPADTQDDQERRIGDSASPRSDSEKGTDREGFLVSFAEESWSAPQLVLATGSPAWPRLGSTDSAARLAARWGHHPVPWRPVLVPLVLPSGWPLHGLEGVSLNARIVVHDPEDGRAWNDPAGVRPLLFTHRGLSGPAALAASCFWLPGRILVVDFLPELSVPELLHQPANGRLLVRNLLARHLPARLVERLVPPDLARRKTAELGREDRERLAEAVHRHQAAPSGTEGLHRAEAAAGGVPAEELSSRLESRFVAGLYVCGEAVDLTGLLGGYNIHWALASGRLAGRALRRFS